VGDRFKNHPAFDGIAWAPLWCEHKGPGRVAWTPNLVHTERVDGQPRQKLLRKFQTLRSCCIRDGNSFVLAAWWHCIEDWQERIKDIGDTEEAFFQRDRKSILAKLREQAPKPSKEAVAAFTTYREQKEAESRAYYEETMDYAEATGQFRSFRFAGSASAEPARAASPDCWTVLGLKPTATDAELKTRHRDLVMQHHPDRGGRHEDFVRFQAAFEEAREILRRR
jgi:DnaJ-domain-containing protein 1